MIKRNEETGGERISSFKKFSEISKAQKTKSHEEAQDMTKLPDVESDRPGNPNLPYRKEKQPAAMSTDYMMPLGQDVESDPDQEKIEKKLKSEDKTNEVKFYGKVAKLPKGVKASKGFNFLENVKISKSSIWYIMVEKQDNELQMLKYNFKKGVDLSKFVAELKQYYKTKYSDNTQVVKLIENIAIDGNDKYSWIKNIPLVQVDGRKMISKITEDLIRLLSK